MLLCMCEDEVEGTLCNRYREMSLHAIISFALVDGAVSEGRSSRGGEVLISGRWMLNGTGICRCA